MSLTKLPTEVLTSIFQFTAPPPVPFPLEDDLPRPTRPFLYPTTLGAVALLWREVVWSTPSLWTSFCCPMSMWQREDRDSPSTLLLLHLQNSKTLPLQLAFSWDEMHEDEMTLFSPIVDPILIASFPRIKTLTLQRPLAKAWFNHLGNLSGVVQLTIEWIIPDITPLDLTQCHSLHHINLNGWLFHTHKLPRSLTSLHLKRIPIDACIELFLQHPSSLVEISLSSSINPFYYRHEFLQLPRPPVVFERLEVLSWEIGREDWDDYFLKHAHTPALRRLRVVNPHIIPVYRQRERHEGECLFLKRLPSTLSTLELHRVEGTDWPSYSSLFESNLMVEHLVLVNCNLDVIVDLINRLTPPENATSASWFLPRLRSISIDGYFKCGDIGIVEPTEAVHRFEHPHSDSLVSMLQKRLTKNDTFHIEVKGITVDWTDEMKAMLQRIAGQGVLLEIFEGSKPVEWLKRTQ
ncbi:hypothetical protein D9756_002669 [Leucocoprinus leucothites]|uniref:F-box domain-containing protein n=1 Tax=Leucocoprinus leucothites TaxID=201217 RepID=A0A8H5GBT1_9AGAR|nr:hypothetical protein D9756_002669 [Leucoagaricus leucothites]